MGFAIRFAVGLLSALSLVCCRTYGQTDDLALKSKRGKDLMAAGKFEEAIPVYRELVKDLPDNPGPVMNLGMALHMAGHEREAVKEFQEVLELEPAHMPARLFLGAAYLALKEPSKAVEPLQTVVRGQPDNSEARLLLGEGLLALEHHRAALQQYEELTRLDPGNPKVWSGLGESLEGLASRSFEEVEKLAPESAYWLVLVAETRAMAEHYGPAFYLYREALAKMPTLRGIHASIADIYGKSGHQDWARVEEEKERQLPPPHCATPPEQADNRATSSASSGAHHNKGADELECDFLAGRYAKMVAVNPQTAEDFYWRTRAYNELARQAFSHLANLPPSAEVHELLAKIHFSQKSYGAAAKDWEEALKLSPGNPYYEQGFAIALSAAGNFEAARPLLEKAVKLSPDTPELNYWAGFTLLGLEKPEEAIPYLEKAVGGDPAVLQPQRDLARAYLRVGQVEKAIPHLKAALPLDNDGTLYYQLAQAYRKAGQKELEKEMLAKFRKIQSSVNIEKKDFEKSLEITPP
jgi:tetratricopeptide (TPR) repeat protein